MVDVAPILSFLARRIVGAPPTVEALGPTGRGTIVKRLREGLILEPQARRELAELGYSPLQADQALVLARLERESDDFADRLTALGEAYNKDIVTIEELKHQLL
ncbi:MAG: hypothetical protein Q8N53_03520, partial [Longimicrobiales bacterium]|nr:hypothetical protein [Longimicrobiales bacterium]